MAENKRVIGLESLGARRVGKKKPARKDSNCGAGHGGPTKSEDNSENQGRSTIYEASQCAQKNQPGPWQCFWGVRGVEGRPSICQKSLGPGWAAAQNLGQPKNTEKETRKTEARGRKYSGGGTARLPANGFCSEPGSPRVTGRQRSPVGEPGTKEGKKQQRKRKERWPAKNREIR